MSRRTEKVAALIHRQVASYLLRLELPALTTISKVEVSPDLKWGKIWVTILGGKELQKQVWEHLNFAKHSLQQEVNKKFKMKIVPKISFVQDSGEEYADHINRLLKKL